MTFVSYAQNFEDVMLWRALKHVENGFYVDVGAQDPIVDSVSLAFYERGWRGVHIEPTPYYAEKLRQHRPDEVVIQTAIGATSGAISFFEIPDTGLSTGDRAIAERHRIQGFAVREVAVPCLTLTQALEQYSDRDIHWLKIDVEGLERQVIEGWDSEKIKPWIVVIESTAPNSPAQVHQEWEAHVLSRGYQFAYFDGLNRFYVSVDRSELLEHFDRPPNLFDDFALSGQASHPFSALLKDGLITRDTDIARLNAHIASQQGEWDSAKAELAQAQQQLATRDVEVSRLNAHIAWQQGEWDDAKAEINRLNAHIAWQQGEWDDAKAEINRLNAHIAWQQGEWDDAKAEINRLNAHIALQQGEWEDAKAEINRLNAHIAWQQGEWDGGEAELARTHQRLSAADAHIAALLSSTSWRFTAPLRALAIGSRGMMDLPARAKLSLKLRLKPHTVRAGAYLAARPGLKAKVLLALRPFPRLQARLARAARPVSTMSNTRAASEQVASLDADHLTPSARRVYQDLLDARSPASLRSGERS